MPNKRKIQLWEPPIEDRQDDPLSWQVRKRLIERRNTMMASLGEPRAGKSDSQKMLGEMCDQNRDFDHTHITFLPQDYLNQIRKCPPGCYIVFDEPGAEWSSRRFMSIVNLLLGATHITMGSRLVNVGWAVPILKMQDINAARMLRYFFIMDTSGPRGTARFYQNWVSQYTGATGRIQLGMVRFNKGFADREEEDNLYEKAKKDYQDKSYEEYYVRFEEEQKKKQAKAETLSPQEVEAIINKIVSHPDAYSIGKRIRSELIENEEKISGNDAKRIRVVAQKRLDQIRISPSP